MRRHRGRHIWYCTTERNSRINESGEGDTDSAEKAMSTNVSETVICADGVNAEMAMNGKNLVAEITYRESFPGIQILIDDGQV